VRGMKTVGRSLGQAFVSQFNPRMLLLSALPFITALLIWGGFMWWTLQLMVDYAQETLMQHDRFQLAGDFWRCWVS